MRRLILLLAAVAAIGAAAWFLSRDREAPSVEVGGIGGEETPSAPVAAAGREGVGPAREAALAPGSGADTDAARRSTEANASVPAPGTGTLLVRVTWQEDQTPAASVAMTVTPARSILRNWSEPVHVTDTTGAMRLPGLVPGPWIARLLHGIEATGEVKPDAVCELQLAIPAGLTVEGAVVDPAGAPVAKAAVFLSQRWVPSLARQVGVADESGRFRLRALTKDHYVSARAEGYAPSCSHYFTGKPGDTVAVKVVLPARGGSVRGVVLDRHGQPAPGAFVLIGPDEGGAGERRDDGAWTPGAPALRVRAGKDGRFEATGVPAGEVAVQARISGHAPWSGTATVPLGSFVELRILLTAGAVLSGTARDTEGKPVGGALVQVGAVDRFGGVATHAGADGVYRLDDLPIGEVEVTADSARAGRDATRLTFGAGAAFTWDPVLRQGLEIRGRVVDEHGAPVGGWRVMASEGAGAERTFGAGTRRADGGFVINVPVDQPYRVMVFEPGDWRSFPRLLQEGVRPGPESLLLQVPPMGTTTATLVGVLQAEGATPPADPQLQIWHETLRIWRVLDLPAAGGPFELAGIPPGKLSIELRDRKHPWVRVGERQAVAGNQLDLGTLRLVEPGHFTGTVTRRDGQPLAGLRWAVTGEDHREACLVTVTGNTYRSGPLAAGTYQLLVMGDWLASFTRDVTVRAGQETRLEVELLPAILRRVRISAPAGAELPRWLWVGVIDDRGQVVWGQSFGRGKDNAVVAGISAPAGSYKVVVQHGQDIVAETTLSFGTGTSGDTVELVTNARR